LTDFTITRGDTVTLNVAATASGAYYPLIGAQVWFTAKYNYSDPDALAVFQKTIGSGIAVTDPVKGLMTMVILPADTAGVASVKVILVYDIQIEDFSGNVYTVASGNLIVVPDVTITT